MGSNELASHMAKHLVIPCSFEYSGGKLALSETTFGSRTTREGSI